MCIERWVASVESLLGGLSGGSSFSKPNRLDLFAGAGLGGSCLITGGVAVVTIDAYESGRCDRLLCTCCILGDRTDAIPRLDLRAASVCRNDTRSCA